MKSKKTQHRAAPQRETTLDKTLKASLWSFLITIGIALALMLIGTALAFLSEDPTAFIDPIGYVTLFMSAFFGGFAACKLKGGSPYLTAALCAAYFVIFSMLLSFIIPHEHSSKMDIFLRLGLHALTYMIFLVGCLAAHKTKAVKKKKLQRKKR